MKKGIKDRIISIPYLGRFLLFQKALALRYIHDRITVEASHLAYVTLLSLVPFFTVLFSMLSTLPVFESTKAHIKDLIFSNFMPVSSDTLTENLEIFSRNASNTTIIGALILLVVSMMLLQSIDSSINHIWKCKEKRPLLTTVSVYWMVITLGPILIGSSLALTSYALSYQIDDGFGIIPFVQRTVIKILPVMFSFVALLLMYSVVPNRKIRVPYAMVGALVAAILLEVGKRLFSLYIIYFPSYQNIYGAIAVVPILLVWIYVSWLIVFIGVEIHASLQDVYDLKKKEAAAYVKDGTTYSADEQSQILENSINQTSCPDDAKADGLKNKSVDGDGAEE
ncbi:MAG: virulence factor BrkB family protein [Succinivibrionaceae bacterium]|nr:virulence factor BrkB family protein [Succinivibrionaceae bacterium]